MHVIERFSRSQVNVIAWPDALFRRIYIDRRFVVEDHLVLLMNNDCHVVGVHYKSCRTRFLLKVIRLLCQRSNVFTICRAAILIIAAVVARMDRCRCVKVFTLTTTEKRQALRGVEVANFL